MKSNCLVIRFLLLFFLTSWGIGSSYGQNVTFYSDCPSNMVEGQNICIPILVRGMQNIDAIQLGLNINKLVFEVNDIQIPSKNPFMLDAGSFSILNGEISMLSSLITNITMNDGDTLAIFCGTLKGQPGDIISIFPNTSFNSILKRDPMDDTGTISVDPDQIEYDFCESTILPVGNALTIVAGHCDKAPGPDPTGKLFLRFLGGTGPYSFTILGDGGFTAAGSGVAFDTIINNIPQELLSVTVIDANMQSTTISIPISLVLPLRIVSSDIINPKCNEQSGGNSLSGVIKVGVTGGEPGGVPSYSTYWSTNEQPLESKLADTVYYEINNKAGGIYSLKIVDRQGCEISDTFELVPPPVLTNIVTNANLACKESNQGEINVTVMGGVPQNATFPSPYYYFFGGRRRDLIGGNIKGVAVNSNIRIYDGNNCFSELILENPDGTSKYKIDSVFTAATRLAFKCFEDPALISTTTVGDSTLLKSVYSFASPRIDKVTKDGDPSFIYNNSGNNRRISQPLGEGLYTIFTTDAADVNNCKDTLTFEITRPEAFVSDTMAIYPDCSDTLGQIQITASGGTFPYAYMWSHDASKIDSLLDSVQVGNYAVTVTDANGCKSQVYNFGFNQTSLLKIDSILVTDTIICGTSGSVQVYTDYTNATYSWSDGTTTSPFLSTSKPGTYFVTVSDNGACAQMDSIYIPERTSYRVFFKEFAPLCSTNMGSETGAIEIDTILGGVPGFTYKWTIRGTNDIVSDTKMASGLTAGQYELTVEDQGGCGFDTIFNLIGPPAIDIKIDTASIKGVTCNQGAPDGRALASASGGDGSPFRYTWSNFERTGLATGLSLGTNTVFAIDGLGCVSDTISVEIPAAIQPTITAIITKLPSCDVAKDGEIMLDIQKSDPNDVVDIFWKIDTLSQTGPIAKMVGVGTVTYFASLNGNINCPIFDTVEVTTAKEFEIAIDPLNTSDNSCKTQGSGTIGLLVTKGEGPVNYTVNGTAFTGDIADSLGSGIYTLIGVNAVGCRDTVEHELNFDQKVVASLVPYTDPKCIGEKICLKPDNVMGGTGRGYTYGIDFGKPVDIAECMELLPGKYFMQVYDSDGCRFDTSFTITFPDKFEIDLGDDITFEVGDDMPEISVDVVSGGAISTVTWEDAANVSCMDSECIAVRIAQFAAFTLKATATSVDGCESSDEITVRVNETENVYIPNIFRPDYAGGSSSNDDNRNSTWQIEVGKGVDKIISMRIFDRWGNKLFELFDPAGIDETLGWDGTYQGHGLNPGVYVYEVGVEFIKRADEPAPKQKIFTGTITLAK